MVAILLTKEEREFLEQFVKKGTKKARTIARARVLLCADKGYRSGEISMMTNVHRQGVWRIQKRYLDGGVDSALNERPRSGQPRKYSEKQEAEIIAMACTTPPKGHARWSVRILTATMRRRKGFQTINRETVRLILKKQGKTLACQSRGRKSCLQSRKATFHGI